MIACANRQAVPSDRTTFGDMIPSIHAEFLEMPGMRLTRPQFRRLWHLTDTDCESVLRHLLATGFLREGREGTVGRPADI
jgi:hypothetical protein